MFYVAYGIGIAAVLLNVYIIGSYIRCGLGKYPPVIGSFGCAREVVLQQAGEILAAGHGRLRVADLGCGYGSLLLPLAERFPQHEFVGLEWDMAAYWLARFRSRNLKNVRIVYGNFMAQSWQSFDLILCFIGNDIAAAVSHKICRECKNSALIISEAFSLPGLCIQKEIEARTYGMPLRVWVYTPRA